VYSAESFFQTDNTAAAATRNGCRANGILPSLQQDILAVHMPQIGRFAMNNQ